MLIAIDHGNSRIKTPLTSFVSGYTKYGTEPPMMAKDVIRFGDSFYALTETRLPYQFNKTQTEDFYLLTLFAIAKEITAREAYQPEETEIELAVGLPPIHYGFLKKPFTDYLMRGQEPVRFSYNGKPFCIRVTRVFVYPQAYAAIATRLTELQSKAYVAVVDIGGFTADILVLRHGKLDMEHCNSLEFVGIAHWRRDRPDPEGCADTDKIDPQGFGLVGHYLAERSGIAPSRPPACRAGDIPRLLCPRSRNLL